MEKQKMGGVVFPFVTPFCGEDEHVNYPALDKLIDFLIENGATVIVIEHDLDVIRSADYLIDMGPGGGEEGGRVVACGTPAEVKRNPESRTGKFI